MILKTQKITHLVPSALIGGYGRKESNITPYGDAMIRQMDKPISGSLESIHVIKKMWLPLDARQIIKSNIHAHPNLTGPAIMENGRLY